MTDKATLQIINAQYTKGFLDAQPGEGYHPRPQASGPYQRVYHEGYSDGQTARKRLADPANLENFRHLVRGDDDDACFELVEFHRRQTAALDERVEGASTVYRVQNEGAARFIADYAERSLVERVAAQVEASFEARVQAEVERRLSAKEESNG